MDKSTYRDLIKKIMLEESLSQFQAMIQIGVSPGTMRRIMDPSCDREWSAVTQNKIRRFVRKYYKVSEE